MAGKIISTTHQINDSATASNNFVLKADNLGGLKLSRGNDGATTQDVLTVDSSGNAQLTKTTAQSMVRLNTANGYGSTNTKIRRFTNVVTNQGSDITYADSATLGASFTINANGTYGISYNDSHASGAIGAITLNDNQGTTNPISTTIGNVLISDIQGGVNAPFICATTVYLAAGSVINAKADGTTGSGFCMFTITRVS